MSRTGFRLEGADEFDQSLAVAGEIMGDRDAVLPVLRGALAPVVERAREIVPVQSGNLRDKIDTSDRAEGETGGEMAAYVGPADDVFYAEDVEFGRPASVSRSGREWDAVPAKPFMRPAWDAEVDGIIDRAADGFGRLIEREA